VSARGAPAPVLSVEGLTIAFAGRRGPVLVVDEVDLELAAGEILAVVGESGAGKTTVGTALAGLLPSRGVLLGGTIALAGRRVDGLAATAWGEIRGRLVGTVFQNPATALNPLFTVGSQLTETIRAHTPLRGPAARERALALLAQVGMPEPAQHLHHHPHQLSGGMLQRVAIALALAPGPRLIVADEPTAGLDVAAQARIVRLLWRISRDSGTAILLISHDLAAVAGVADRIAVMYAGRVVETGSTDTVLTAAHHPYTRGLLAAVPCMDDAARRLRPMPGAMPSDAREVGGCAFHPRCPHAFERCRHERPTVTDRGPTRFACWLDDPEAPRA
jgi:peptide/nickel transport system ATP-binding protein